MTENCAATTGDSLEQKLLDCIQSLLQSATDLRAALVKRDAEAIWDALGEQEKHAGLLNEYSSLWQELAPPAEQTHVVDPQRRRIRIELKRLQALQRANSMLAQSFLSAIRKAIDSVTSPQNGASAGTYSRLGRHRAGSRSNLVKKFG